MGISSVWIDILEVSSIIDSTGGDCEGCLSVGGNSGDLFA